jgi:hypothetical protein
MPPALPPADSAPCAGVRVRSYMLRSALFLKNLSQQLREMQQDHTSGYHRSQGWHPGVYVARLDYLKREVHNFRVTNRTMDAILESALDTRKHHTLESEILLWRRASSRHALLASLLREFEAAVRSSRENPHAPPSIWPVVTSGIADIENALLGDAEQTDSILTTVNHF